MMCFKKYSSIFYIKKFLKEYRHLNVILIDYLENNHNYRLLE